jgi:hypothetical protein
LTLGKREQVTGNLERDVHPARVRRAPPNRQLQYGTLLSGAESFPQFSDVSLRHAPRIRRPTA